MMLDSQTRTWPTFREAIRCAIDGNKEKAILELARLGEQDRDMLSHYLAESLSESDSGITNEDIFRDNAIYEAVTSLTHFRQMRESFAAKAVEVMATRMTGIDDYCLLDIGVGDGKQLCEILKRLDFRGRIHLAILDSSARLLGTANERLVGLRDSRVVEVRKVLNKIENMNVSSLLQLFGCSFHTAIGSNSLHHVPYERKGQMLAMMRGICRLFLLHELDAEHDRPEGGDPALIYSVWSTFNKSIEITLRSEMPSEYKEMAIKRFFIPEARNILLKPRADRGDYHTTKENWKELVSGTSDGAQPNEEVGDELVAEGYTFEDGPMKMYYQAYEFGGMSRI